MSLRRLCATQAVQQKKPLGGKHQKSEDNDRKVCRKGGGRRKKRWVGGIRNRVQLSGGGNNIK